ncbi:MAG: sigma-54 dependent transcriptional regulator [Proteobacteria bacterium]|nr:sigma-54 dependent transcriptional regulator [Pseudomonadota bacterium]
MSIQIETSETLASAQDKPGKPGIKILVVDDEKNIRSTLHMVLSGQGHDVKVASDGVEAQTILNAELFDLILLDVRLPGKSGTELLTEWHARYPNLLIILMSGEATLTEALDGLKKGAFDFLEKPILTARLMKSIEHVTERIQVKCRIDLGHGETVIGDSPILKKTMEEAKKVAGTKARVLITGESGTGKDLLARMIHLQSARSDRAFIKINCAGISPEIIESELFGHVKGAFTGATGARRGHFETAHGGTLFLDEIGELPLAAQAKMLRVLQNGEITPVGSSEIKKVDVRVIAATNRDLKKEVDLGRFREDLYYRLAVVTIHSPSLRERKDDLSKLVSFFIHQISTEYGTNGKSVDPMAMDAMMNYNWQGNVRELRNVIERCMILCGASISLADLPPEISSAVTTLSPSNTAVSSVGIDSSSKSTSSTLESWHDFKMRSEREHIIKAINMAQGSMSDAARLLKVERQTMYKWMKAYGIEKQIEMS